jgi:hypothetical protein
MDSAGAGQAWASPAWALGQQMLLLLQHDLGMLALLLIKAKTSSCLQQLASQSINKPGN